MFTRVPMKNLNGYFAYKEDLVNLSKPINRDTVKFIFDRTSYYATFSVYNLSSYYIFSAYSAIM